MILRATTALRRLQPILTHQQQASTAFFHHSHTMSQAQPHALRHNIQTSLLAFASSPSSFQVLQTVPTTSPCPTPARPLTAPHTLYVLDSSYNPPSKAHSTLARKAVLADTSARPVRVCLLLATENADKKPKPASFEDRLVMMTLMANDLRASIRAESGREIDVDVAVTKEPFFKDKAASIDESGVYAASQQVHCTGYDTIIRIFNPKYYPEDSKLSVLAPFLGKHRLRVSYRVGEGAEGGGDRDDQDKYVHVIGDGSRADEGMRAEWRDAIELVNDAEEVRGVSSTKAREAAIAGNRDGVVRLLGEDVAEYVMNGGFYKE